MSARRDDPDLPVSERRDYQDISYGDRQPFDMAAFANKLLAGMAARHAPQPDERPETNPTEREEWTNDPVAQSEYQQWLDANG